VNTRSMWRLGAREALPEIPSADKDHKTHTAFMPDKHNLLKLGPRHHNCGRQGIGVADWADVAAVLPCKSPFACLPLQAGGDAGSGNGYCTFLGQQSREGAAAITVSNRVTEGGSSCRLPIVYK
jgi:hypothetical protein